MGKEGEQKQYLTEERETEQDIYDAAMMEEEKQREFSRQEEDLKNRGLESSGTR